jgi:hypothetical protein
LKRRSNSKTPAPRAAAEDAFASLMFDIPAELLHAKTARGQFISS